MLKYIEETGKYVEITAFRRARISKVEDLLKTVDREKPRHVWVQFFDAELVATWQHLYFAVFNALVASKNARNISKNPAMEVMLYASAQHQIRKAIDLLGVKCGLGDVAAVIIGENPEHVKAVLAAVSAAIGVAPDDAALELSDKKIQRIREAYEISDKELEAVKEKDNIGQALIKLVIERVALLATQV